MTENKNRLHVEQKDIKIIKLVNGQDIITVLPTGQNQLAENNPLIRLIRPLEIKYVPQVTPHGFRDYVALIKWAAYTDDQIVTIPKDKILTVTNASAPICQSYFNITTNEYEKENQQPEIKKHPEPRRFTDEENQHLNEIFDEVGDDDPPTFH